MNTNTKPLKNSGILSNGIIEFQNRKSITENLEIPLIRDKVTEKTVFSRFCKTVKMIEEEIVKEVEDLLVKQRTFLAEEVVVLMINQALRMLQ